MYFLEERLWEVGATERWRDPSSESHRPLDVCWPPPLTDFLTLEKFILLFYLLFSHMSDDKPTPDKLDYMMSVKTSARCLAQWQPT